MNLQVDDSYLIEENCMLQDYMEEVRTKTIERLTPLELAAIFEDFREFRIRLMEEREISKYEYYEE
jgi:hypothetical protein